MSKLARLVKVDVMLPLFKYDGVIFVLICSILNVSYLQTFKIAILSFCVVNTRFT